MIDRESDAVRTAIEVLNRVHQADPTVLPALIAYRVPCNLAVADDTTVQVGKIKDTDDQWEVGLLGIINGLYGVQGPKAIGFIAAEYDDDHKLTHFSYNELPAEARRTRDQSRLGSNTGHGHVYPRPDGVKARCGGPTICAQCAREAARAGGDESGSDDA